MLRTYRYRIYPTKEQQEVIEFNSSACRFVYNLALETKNYAYRTHRVYLNQIDLCNQLPELKEQCPWMKKAVAKSLQGSIRNLERNFSQFLQGHKRAPKYKSKKDAKDSVQFHESVTVEKGKLWLPKVNTPIRAKSSVPIRIALHRTFTGEIKTTTVSRTATRKWFVSFLVEDGKDLPAPVLVTADGTVGVDFGIKDFATLSTGEKIDTSRHLRQSLKKLARLQRRMKAKKIGSQNFKKAACKVALVHEKVANKRKDFLHKISARLVSENQAICLETLSIESRQKNKRLAKCYKESAWATFVEMVKYKTKWQGKHVMMVGKWEPASKRCSCCAVVNRELAWVNRSWTCGACGAELDRDSNAALNIKQVALVNYFRTDMPEKPVESRIDRGREAGRKVSCGTKLSRRKKGGFRTD